MPGSTPVAAAQDLLPAAARPHREGSTLTPGESLAVVPIVRPVPGAASGELLVAGTIALWGALRARRRALLEL